MGGPKREGKKGTRLLGEILSREKGTGFPGYGKQPVLAKEKKRQTEREGPLLGKAEGSYFPGSRTRAYHLAPGGGEERPIGCLRGTPDLPRGSRGGAEFPLPNPGVVSGRCHGAAGWGEGSKGGGDGIPPSRKSFSGGGARPSPSSVLQTAESGSRRPHRQRGAPQRPPHRPLGPRGPETLTARALGAGHPCGLPQLPREHTGTTRLPRSSQRL